MDPPEGQFDVAGTVDLGQQQGRVVVALPESQFFVAGTVDFEYLHENGALVRPEGNGRRAWGPCATQERAEFFRDLFATLPRYSDVEVIRGVIKALPPRRRSGRRSITGRTVRRLR